MADQNRTVRQNRTVHVSYQVPASVDVDVLETQMVEAVLALLPAHLNWLATAGADTEFDDVGSLEAETRVGVARIVAEHWRRAALEERGGMRFVAHPMCMILAALDGETDPVQLGVDEGPDADAIRGL